eukprot:TRINITY_DN91827_c0_g1_i1.p1 TRINITY_DN91827_c0_g1~~TRINITY_DN91827_c0_g1_i1.p1  ORF type:complete len:444 (-),score=105.93 TRINITY_DN91827_c0_g1_i1:206-1345(-)
MAVPVMGGTMQLPVGGAMLAAAGGLPFAGGSMQVRPAPVPAAPAGPAPPTVSRPVDGDRNAELTSGFPDPESVRQQKDNFAKDLEDQLKTGVERLGVTHKQQMDLLKANANQEKHRYNLVLDQQVKQQELMLSQQYNEQLMRLQQAAQHKRAELEKQACGLILEYQQRKVQEEFMAQQVGIQKQHSEAQHRLQEEMTKLGPSTAAAAAPTAAASTAPPPALSFVPAMPTGGQPQAAYAAPPRAPTAINAPPRVGGVLQYVPPAVSRSATPTPVMAYSAPPSHPPSFAFQSPAVVAVQPAQAVVAVPGPASFPAVASPLVAASYRLPHDGRAASFGVPLGVVRGAAVRSISRDSRSSVDRRAAAAGGYPMPFGTPTSYSR